MSASFRAPGLYIHWPYCTRICPYCDFNVTRPRQVDEAQWRKVLLQDLAYWREKLGKQRIGSVYFGGGTPSLMSPRMVGAVLQEIDKIFGIERGIEITLEANPTDAETALLSDFAKAGVNRLSVGVQSFEDRQLSFLGRNHTGQEALRAIEATQKYFSKYSIDLIYALPDQKIEDWEKALYDVFALGVRHLSAYQLTIEPKTAFAYAVARQQWHPVNSDMEAEFYAITQALCDANNLPAYEISNHAAPGHESVHNSKYWQYSDYIGIGPGAHGRVHLNGNLFATTGIKNIKRYLETYNRYELEKLSPGDQATEYLTMSLRHRAGSDLSRFASLAGAPLSQERYAPLCQDGYIRVEDGVLELTPKGRPLLNQILLELLR
ncbi:MAG: radical SAM family heme chaperone HemW [bacterium]